MRALAPIVAPAFMTCVSLFASVEHVHAAPRPPVAYVLKPEVAIPSNGAILIATEGSSEAPFVAVSPTGTASSKIEGALTRRSNLWAWLPALPFEPGSYDVTVQAEAGGGAAAPSTTITVVDAFPIEPPELTIEADLDKAPEAYGSACCTREALGTAAHCIRSENDYHLWMYVHLDSSSSPELLHQFLIGVARSDQTNSESLVGHLVFPLDTHLTYVEQADEYCFEVLALDITTGAMHSFPAGGPECHAHGDLGFVGTEQLEIPSAFFDRRDCPAPPLGFEESWCAENESACSPLDASEAEQAGCRYYDFVCNGAADPDQVPDAGVGGTMSVPPSTAGTGGAPSADAGAAGTSVPMGGAGGSGGSPAMSGASGAAGMQSQDVDMPQSDEAPHSSASGCGCEAAGSRSASTTLAAFGWLTLIALVALRMRRSATR